MNDYKHLFDMTGQVALIVGGAGGLGRDMALALAQYGADIAVAQRNPEKGNDLKETITKTLGRRCELYKVDVLEENSVKLLVDKIDADFGRLDILINSAGLNILQKAEEYATENWDTVLDLNLKGAYLACREASRIMIRQKKGKIINLSSVRGNLGMPEGFRMGEIQYIGECNRTHVYSNGN